MKKCFMVAIVSEWKHDGEMRTFTEFLGDGGCITAYDKGKRYETADDAKKGIVMAKLFVNMHEDINWILARRVELWEAELDNNSRVVKMKKIKTY